MITFNKLTKQKQRTRIVKDAIAQINIGTLKVKPQEYFNIPSMGWLPGEDVKDLKQLLEGGTGCECCAKGSLFAACVLNVNKITTHDDLDDEPFQKSKLKKWFSELELDMIETAFELDVITDSSRKLTNSEWEATDLGVSCIKFGKQFRTPKKRLLSILKNILKNGKFAPAQ